MNDTMLPPLTERPTERFAEPSSSAARDRPHPAAISLSFDFQQTSRQLCWSAVDGHRDIFKHRGMRAGGVWLNPGEDVSVIVRGGGYLTPEDPPWDFRILECVILTVPETRSGGPGAALSFSQPSPFIGVDDRTSGAAVRRVENLLPHGTDVDKTGYRVVEYRADRAFRVIAPDPALPPDAIGRWDMTFVLTVEIDVPHVGRYRRVFRHDPETEVGNGLNRAA